jgi:LPS biosynthesis glycosyltransferase-like protein
MIRWLYIDLSVLLCVATLTGIIIPQILLIAFRKQLFDEPDPRKIHTSVTPRLGGIAFFPSILFAILMLLGLGMHSHDVSMVWRLQNNLEPLCFTACGALLLYLTGMADDLIGVRYSAKFVMQTLSAALVIAGGCSLGDLHGFLGIYGLPAVADYLLSGLVIVFVINSINLIDGIDGLASGLSAIACAFYTYVFLNCGLYFFSALAVATLGALLPFFYYNVFGDAAKRKKIFMGDTGALTVGLFLSVMSIRICSERILPGDANPAVVAFAPILIPCFDVIRVYLHRLKAGRNPFLPDRTHIHHKLLALGMHQRSAMMTIIFSSAALTAANYWLSHYIGITELFFSDLLVWIMFNILLTRAIRARERQIGSVLYK